MYMKRIMCILLILLILLLVGCFGGGSGETDPQSVEPIADSTEELLPSLPTEATDPGETEKESENNSMEAPVQDPAGTEETEEYIPPTLGENETPIA